MNQEQNACIKFWSVKGIYARKFRSVDIYLYSEAPEAHSSQFIPNTTSPLAAVLSARTLDLNKK